MLFQITPPDADMPANQDSPRPRRRLWIPITIAILLLAVLVLLRFTYRVYSIPSESMMPTLPSGSKVVVNKLAYRFGSVRHGDIIVFRDDYSHLMTPETSTVKKPAGWVSIKRIIALPGDTILILAGQGVYLNGQLLNEPYAAEKPMYSWPPTASGQAAPVAYRIPKGRYFVLGDNRNRSLDSHSWMDPRTNKHYPTLPIKHIIGRVSFVHTPGGSWRSVP